MPENHQYVLCSSLTCVLRVRGAHEIVLECGDLSPLSFFNIGFKSADKSAHSPFVTADAVNKDSSSQDFGLAFDLFTQTLSYFDRINIRRRDQTDHMI